MLSIYKDTRMEQLMKNPSIENIIKHNEKIIEKCRTQESYTIKYRSLGWIQALNYIKNNYNIEEK